MEVDKDGPVLKMGSGYTLRFEDDADFEDAYRERAKNDLGETPERRSEALEHLRKLIRGNIFFRFILRPYNILFFIYLIPRDNLLPRYINNIIYLYL